MKATRRKQSPETIAKRVASLRAWAEANPEAYAAKIAAQVAGSKRWRAIPENAAKISKMHSERMTRRHAEGDWKQEGGRSGISSRTMKATWEKHREHLTAVAHERYASMVENGTGLCSTDSMARKAKASKWIMKQAQGALHAETDYDEVYAEVQARLRRECPYDGPPTGEDYMDYLRKLGRDVVNSPECRELADSFMAKAIPRFAAEWKKKKDPS